MTTVLPVKADPQVPVATVTVAPVPFDVAAQRRLPHVAAGTTVCVLRSSVVPTAPTASMYIVVPSAETLVSDFGVINA